LLIDCGCSEEGYQPDISGTFVFGDPSKKQQTIWNTVREAQFITFETTTLGTPAGKVDGTVRTYYVKQGRPDYKLPELSIEPATASSCRVTNPLTLYIEKTKL
jgi:Xaa-Pro dipeptidase